MKKTFEPKELKLFEKLVSLDQKSLKKNLSSYLRKNYKRVIETKDYLVAEGNIPIALVAHMDTVFITPVKTLYHDQRKNTMWSPEGLGADDRAGVFAILQILRSGLRPHVIFTTDEEKGCIGAEKLAMKKCPFKDIKYLIELDRRGICDCVFYECDNKKFVEYVEKYGFLENWGTYSDISEICPAWKIAGVNLSVGYNNEHSVIETLNLSVLYATIEKVKKMLNDAVNAPKFKYIPFEYCCSLDWGKNFKFSDYYLWNKFGSHSVKEKDTYICNDCGLDFLEEEIFLAKTDNGSIKYFCPECVAKNVDWCILCNEPFETKDLNQKYCKDCREEIAHGEFNADKKSV